MRASLFTSLLIVAACAPTLRSEIPAAAPAREISIQQIPRTVGTFSQTETERYRDPGAGVLYRYRGPSQLQPDVYIYPVGKTARSGGSEPRTQAAAESRLFKIALDYERRRGRFDSFTVLADSAVVIQAGPHRIEGWHTHARLLRRGEARQTHQHLFVLGEQLVKVRTTFAPGSEAARDLQPFIGELLRMLLASATGPA